MKFEKLLTNTVLSKYNLKLFDILNIRDIDLDDKYICLFAIKQQNESIFVYFCTEDFEAGSNDDYISPIFNTYKYLVDNFTNDDYGLDYDIATVFFIPSKNDFIKASIQIIIDSNFNLTSKINDEYGNALDRISYEIITKQIKKYHGKLEDEIQIVQGKKGYTNPLSLVMLSLTELYKVAFSNIFLRIRKYQNEISKLKRIKMTRIQLKNFPMNND